MDVLVPNDVADDVPRRSDESDRTDLGRLDRRTTRRSLPLPISSSTARSRRADDA